MTIFVCNEFPWLSRQGRVIDAIRCFSQQDGFNNLPAALKRELENVADNDWDTDIKYDSCFTETARDNTYIPLWISFCTPRGTAYFFEASCHRWYDAFSCTFQVFVLHKVDPDYSFKLKFDLPAIVVPKHRLCITNPSGMLYSTWGVWKNGFLTDFEVVGLVDHSPVSDCQLMRTEADHTALQKHGTAAVHQLLLIPEFNPKPDNSRIITSQYRQKSNMPPRRGTEPPNSSDKQSRKNEGGSWSPQISQKKRRIEETVERDQAQHTAIVTCAQPAKTANVGTPLSDDDLVLPDDFDTSRDGNVEANDQMTSSAIKRSITPDHVAASSQHNGVYFHFKHRDDIDVVRRQPLAKITSSDDIFNHARSGRNPILSFGMNMLSVSVDGGTPWNIMKDVDDDYKDVIDEIECRKRTSNKNIIVAVMPADV